MIQSIEHYINKLNRLSTLGKEINPLVITDNLDNISTKERIAIGFYEPIHKNKSRKINTEDVLECINSINETLFNNYFAFDIRLYKDTLDTELTINPLYAIIFELLSNTYQQQVKDITIHIMKNKIVLVNQITKPLVGKHPLEFGTTTRIGGGGYGLNIIQLCALYYNMKFDINSDSSRFKVFITNRDTNTLSNFVDTFITNDYDNIYKGLSYMIPTHANATFLLQNKELYDIVRNYNKECVNKRKQFDSYLFL